MTTPDRSSSICATCASYYDAEVKRREEAEGRAVTFADELAEVIRDGGEMSRIDYYKECLADSLEEHGVTATPEQVAAIATDIWHARDMEAESFGDLCIPNPLQTEMGERDRRHKQELSRVERERDLYCKAVEAPYRGRAYATIRDGRVEIEVRR
jgi:hypothetical protein